MAEGMSRDTATKANYFSRNPDELRRREESVGMFRINDIIQHVKKDVGKAEFFRIIIVLNLIIGNFNGSSPLHPL